MAKQIEKTARRYAASFFQLAKENGRLKKISEDISAIRGLIKDSKDFSEFLNNPLIPRIKQKAVLTEIFSKKSDALTLNFLLFIADKEKLSILDPIARIFQEFYLDELNIMEVKVISAVDLRPDQVEEIANRLKTHFRKNIQPEPAVDPDLLGGFKIQIGDQVYDFSLRQQLERFRQSVLAAS